jgi:hypothetical protein
MLRKFVRFMTVGPGVVLLVVGAIIGVVAIVHEGQERQAAEAAKHQVKRPLGEVKPPEVIDKSRVPKEVVISNRALVPGGRSEQESDVQAAPIQNASDARAALPTLVSFYTAQASEPSISPSPPPAEVNKDPSAWLPPGTFVPCALVNTVESSHINTPVMGEVLRDVCQNGHLIIPAGAVASSFAQSGAVRDRIEVAGTWVIVYPDGRHLKVHGIACDREADPTNQQFGIEDGSAGLQGEIVESDHWAMAKAFVALLLTATMQTGTAVATSALQAQHTTGVVGLPDTTPILGKYLDQLLNGETGDGRFVRVRASKEFYVFVTETVVPASRTIADEKVPEDNDESKIVAPVPGAENDKILLDAAQMERAIQEAAQTKENTQHASPTFSY